MFALIAQFLRGRACLSQLVGTQLLFFSAQSQWTTWRFACIPFLVAFRWSRSFFILDVRTVLVIRTARSVHKINAYDRSLFHRRTHCVPEKAVWICDPRICVHLRSREHALEYAALNHSWSTSLLFWRRGETPMVHISADPMSSACLGRIHGMSDAAAPNIWSRWCGYQHNVLPVTT